MTSGFHWFVAWRYLMARPRSGSPTLVAFASLLCVIGAVFAAIANDTLVRISDNVGHHAVFAYRAAIKGSLVLFGLAGASLVVAAVGHTARDRTRVAMPFVFTLGCMTITGGLIARSSSDTITHTGATIALIAGAVLVLVSLSVFIAHAFRYSAGGLVGRNGPFVAAGLLAAAGGALVAVAEYTLEPTADLALLYRPEWVRLPAFGAWAVGFILSVYVTIGYIGRRRPKKRLIGVAALLLCASAVYPGVMVKIFNPLDFESFNLVQPDLARYATWAALGLGGLALTLALTAIIVRVTSSQSRTALLWQLAGAALAAGALAFGLARFVWSSPELPVYVPEADVELDQQLLLIGVGALALAELALVLGVVRYLFTFFTTVSIAGVAIGTMALVIVLSVMSGFENDLRRKILGNKAHMLVTKHDGEFTEYKDVAARIEQVKGVVATNPYLESELVIAANKNYSTAVIKGVNPRTLSQVTELDEHVQDKQAFDRLWPLADDGSVLGPPTDAGEPEEPEGNGDGAPDLGNGVDPPPPDFLGGQLGDPESFSEESEGKAGSEAKGDGDSDGDGDSGTEIDSETGLSDPPPADLDIDLDGPEVFATGDDESDTTDDPGDPGDPFAGLEEIVDGVDDGDDLFGDSDTVLQPFDKDPLLDPLATEALLLPGDGDDDERPRIAPEVARLPGVLVGRELKKQIHLYTGQEVRIISPLYQDTPAGPVPRTRSLRVADVFYTGMYEYDFMNIYVALDVLQAFLELDGQVTGIEIRVKDPDNTGPVLGALRQMLPDDVYRVQDWQEINRSLFSALKLEKIAMFLVLAIIILVASFSIIGNLIMVVIEKAREIALIKTLGSSNFGIMKIFVSQGLFIGVVGTAIGVLHGLVACSLGSKFGLPLNPEVYYIDRLPIHVEQGAVLAVTGAGMLISVIATIYPAYVGARLRPIEGLRYE